MNEAQWLASTDPVAMLRFLLGTNYPRVQDLEAFPACKGSDRKMRLFACACYWHVSHLLPDSRARTAVEVAEQVADGVLLGEDLERTEARLRSLLAAIEERWESSRSLKPEGLLATQGALALALQTVVRQAPKAAYYASSNAYLTFAEISNPGVPMYESRFFTSKQLEAKWQAEALRCIFGNLFHPETIEPEWWARSSGSVTKLALGIYEDRAFDRLPILADALEDVGCQDGRILDHCRQGGVHVRGCWVVDGILGRE